MKALLFASLLSGGILLTGGAAGAGPQQWSKDPATQCRFVMPRSLPTGPTYWIGDCTGGKASGLGALVRRDGAKSREIFYGLVEKGVPAIGAIDLNGGYKAGRFVDGDIGGGEGSFNETQEAFDFAARAARAVSARFQAQNNADSARFYDQQAKILDEQIE